MSFVIERLRRIFDILDPMPAAPAAPMDIAYHHINVVPDTGTRGTCMRFERGEVTIHLEIGSALTGMVIGATELEIRWPNGMTQVTIDPMGLFEVDCVPRGPARLVVGTAATDWFVR
ncbi:hypothetical protein [Actinocrispum sp. NPDC049592]|uniref:hypothetical protein n=1 Tax=Actinocrispum sp. NPDC049592 TaxID=3154835 RepID=UPI003445F65E